MSQENFGLTREEHHKTLAYIMIGVIVVLALAYYMYAILSNAGQKPAPAQQSAPGTVVLTPEESAEKSAVIENAMGQSAVTLSGGQASRKAALLRQMGTQ